MDYEILRKTLAAETELAADLFHARLRARRRRAAVRAGVVVTLIGVGAWILWGFLSQLAS